MKAVALILLVVTSVLCAEASAQQPREDLDLRAFLLQEILKSCSKTGEVCYVAFASRQDPGTRKTVYTDPPPEFLTRFARSSYTVKTASLYPGAAGEPPKANPATGIPDGIYTVEIKRWLDKSSARVSISLYRSETWARGYEAIVDSLSGRWEVRERLSKWSR